MIWKRNWNQIRAATTLAATLSIMAAASSSDGAESEHPSLSWLDGFDAHLGSWSGQLGLGYMNGTGSASSPDGSTSTSTTSAFQETLRIDNSGFYILSPRLVNGSMALDLALDQDKSGDSGNSTATQNKVIGYNFDATFLDEKPYTATVSANLSHIQALQPFGGRMVGSIENRWVQFYLLQDSVLSDWGYPWVNASLGIHESNNHSVTTSFGHSLSTDEQSRTLSFSANKGFETADLGFSYQLNDTSNAAFSQGKSQSMATGLNYSLDFGPNLNRSFSSNLSYATNAGVSSPTTISNSEHLHIDHYRSLSTDYRYGFTQQTFGGVSTLAQNGAFTVSHQLYQNLNTSVGVSGSQTTVSNGSFTSYGGNLGQSYRHSLPGNGRFSATWSGSYRLNSNNLSASSIPVIENISAPLCAPNCLSTNIDDNYGILLKYPFVLGDPVVVRTSDNKTFTNGLDYSVTKVNNQTKITPLPGGGIGSNDSLAVTYNYQVDANLKSAMTSSAFGMGVNYRWISMSFNHAQSTQTPLSQTTSMFLQDTRQNQVQIALQGTLLEMPANATMSLENDKSSGAVDTVYDLVNFGGFLVWASQSNMNMIFGMNGSDTKYKLPDQHTSSSLSAHSSLNWYSGGGWTHTASVEWSNYKDSRAPATTLVQAIGQSSITLGLLSLRANVALGEWLRNGSRSTNRSLNISIVRRFQ